MQDDGGSGSDDEQYTQADQNRISELFPRDLTSLFAPSPQLVAPCVPHNQPLAVAGTQGRSDVSLERMQVVMRIRPSMQHGIPSWSKENCIHAVSGSTVAIAPPESSQGYKNGDRGQTYNFTRVFNEHTAQEEYFQATAAPLVRHLVQEQQAAAVLMAYGISAAGKTYTIEGTRSEPGVLPRALHLLFQEVQDSPEQLTVHVSQFEVYNEQIYDLLAEEAGAVLGQRPALRLKEDSQGRIFVRGLSEVAVGSAGAALDMQRKGARQRQKAATALNYHSSRSHSIFMVALYRASGPEHEEESARVGRLSFVDLAGSERANRTANVGARLKESVAINASLMTLGRCLEALRWNQQHRAAEPKLVPYRESKVTHVFRDVLHGWGQILLSVNVSPCAKDYDETSHVLKYASLATQIGTAARAEEPIRALRAISPNITKKRAPRLEPVPSNLGPLKKQRKYSPSAKQASDAAPLPEALSADADLGEEEAYASSCSSDAEEESAVVQELQEEVRHLHDQLVAAEERCALAETEIREEVSTEMAALLHDMEADYKERLASEVAAVEKRKNGGTQSGRAAAPVHSSHSQTVEEPTQAELHSMAQQLAARDGELEALRAELQRKTQALESALEPYSGLKHSHDALLSRAQASETAHAEEKKSLSEQLQKNQQDLTASQDQCKQLLQQLHDSDQQLSTQAQQITAAESVLTAQISLQSQLTDMTQQLETAQAQILQLEPAYEKSAQQLREAHRLNSELDQAQEQWRSVVVHSSQLTFTSYADTEAAAAAASTAADPLQAIQHVVSALHSRAEEAQAAVEKLSQQVQEAAAAHALEAEHLRGELQQAKMKSQAGQPHDQSAQGLRQSLERELQQQVTQLEANSQMEVEMLQQQMEAAKKENTALKRRLEAATAALASANLSAANPALLRVMQAGAKGGSQRGAGGTPHALALAWAREEAARLSPALTLASTSKTPYPGVANKGASPAPSLAHLFPPSPHAAPSTLSGGATAVMQKHGLMEQQQALEPAVFRNAAAESASDAQETRAQRETDVLSATQAASRLSLLQAEQTQAELELASAAHSDVKSQVQAEPAEPDKQQQACKQLPIDALLICDAGKLSHYMLQQEAAVARATEAEVIGPSSARAEQAESFSFVHLSEHQLRQPVAQAAQSEPLRPSQPVRLRTRRQTRSSARTSQAAQSVASEFLSTASGRRGKAEASAMPALPAVIEQAEADSAEAVSASVMTEPAAAQAAAALALDPAAELAARAHQPEATLATVAEEEKQQSASAPSQEHVNSLEQMSNAAEHQKLVSELLQEVPNAHNSQPGGCPATASVNCIADEQAVASAEAVSGNDTTHAYEDRASMDIGTFGTSCAEAAAASTAGAAASQQRPHMQFQAKTQIAEDVSGQTAESQQGQKRWARAKRPPKPKQPARKKQTGKRGRPAAQQDENANSNLPSTQQSGSLATSAGSVAKEPVVSPTSCEAVTNPPAFLNAADPDMAADKEPRAGGKPKRRKLQPATPISHSVQETLTDFVADDSHFRQHMKQTPVALRTRRATRFGGL